VPERLPIDEAPRYLIFAKKPPALHADVTVSTPPSDMKPLPKADAGKLQVAPAE
jgi:hypothetical protein